MFDIEPRPPTASQEALLAAIFGGNGASTYIFGRNSYAVSVAATVQVAGFIDDYTTDREFLGHPVLRMSEVPMTATVISCVVEAHPVTALRRLREHGLVNVVDYFLLSRAAPGQFQGVAHLSGSIDDARSHTTAYEALYHALANDESRDVLKRVLEFRCTGDVSRMEPFTVDVTRQYFEPFVTCQDGEVFVDGGGFDGGTTLEFIKRWPDYGSVHFFEPSNAAMSIARGQLAPEKRVRYIPKGLYDRNTQLNFDGSSGSASRVAESGCDVIDVATLDSEVSSPVNFIKLDVEGAECAALEGARRHIIENHPKLAVCVYHNQSDFWRVPEIVLGLRADYNIYLHHYSEGVLETVMYFIPAT